MTSKVILRKDKSKPSL